ncbi:MAG: UDP-3-O-(3-hydroxymyristoyl)glucosamine N-acyltransferase [Proteobacteria bacterium]|nr:UDP-3-O-(3-hydroxymyristoyl)glucosamine N-acyltransferase [Pseudomonadota bacterium]
MFRTVSELAGYVEGEVLGRKDLQISELKALDEATADSICPFFRKKLLRQIDSIPGAVLTTSELARPAIEAGIQSAVVHNQPMLALARLIDLFYPEEIQPTGIHPTATVDQDAQVHPSAWIGPSVVVESGAVIGEGSWVGPGAVICADCSVGKHVRIGPGAVIGAEGFGFVPSADGPVKIRQVGRAVIEDFVEIGANTCVDRATLGTTVVGRSSKLDNLVQVGHNVRIGERVLIAGQTGLAGSTVIGDDAMLGGKVGVADHLEIGARAKIAAKSGVTGDIAADEVAAGYPALPHAKWLRAMAWLARKSAHMGKSDAEES